MPELDSEQRKIVRLIRKEGRRIKDPSARRRYERAAVQTGLVESGLRNLSYGDADSQGWRQERASLYADPTNLRKSIRRFRQEFQQHADPGEKSYEVAAQVQRPREDLRGRYREEAGKAAQILRNTGPGPQTGSQGAPGPRYGTVPGVDNESTRTQLRQAYFSNHTPTALLELKSGLDDAQDVPSRRVRLKTPARPPGQSADRSRGNPGETTIKAIIKEAERRGLTVGEHPSRGGVAPVHTEGSYHDRPATRGGRQISRGSAADITGDLAELAKFKRWLRKRYGRDLEELIGNFGGGRNLKDGRKVGPGFYSGHEGHLHAADDD